MKDKIKRSIRKINKKVVIWKLGRKVWHSKAWTEKKRELRREMRKMRKGKIDREEYIRRRKEYRKYGSAEKKKRGLKKRKRKR